MRTGRNIQRDLFLGSLRQEMQKISSSMRKNELAKTAEEYLSEGMSPSETEELLVVDGYDPSMAKACVSMLTAGTQRQVESPEWGFEVEDSYGRIYSNFDIDITVTASSEVEALVKAAEVVAGSDGEGVDKVTKVFRL